MNCVKRRGRSPQMSSVQKGRVVRKTPVSRPEEGRKGRVEHVLLPIIVASSLSEVATNKAGQEAFIKTLIHALQCGTDSCSQLACQKMCMVLSHFLSCGKLVSQRKTCGVCHQLVGVITSHALHSCRATEACPVPMCDLIKKHQMANTLTQLKREMSELQVKEEPIHEEEAST